MPRSWALASDSRLGIQTLPSANSTWPTKPVMPAMDTGALHAEQVERADVVLHVDDERRDQRVDEACQEEYREEARFAHILEGVARNHQEAREGRRQRAVIRPVGFLIDGHRRSPWL